MSGISPSPRAVDVTGTKFGRLTALERQVFTTGGGHRSSRYVCRCDCGNTTVVALNNLTAGGTRSCGCFRKEVTSIRKRRPDSEIGARLIWNYYVRNAKTRGISWDLTWAEFLSLIAAPCHYCGITGANETKIRTFAYNKESTPRILRNNGIDRVDNSIGYRASNCVTACKRCNQSKNDRCAKEFLSWIERVHNHQASKNT